MSIFNTKELAEAKQQTAHLAEQLNAAQRAADYHAQTSRTHEAKAQSAERARDEAEYALRQAQQEIATLKAAVTQMNGESLFVRVGKARHLISSIHTIVADDNGKLASVNGRDCDYTATLPAEALENIVVAYHNRRRASR